MSDHHASTDGQQTLEHEVGTVATALRIGIDRHPSPRQLSHYQRGELSAADTETLQDHLAQCPECAELVLDLDGFGDLGHDAEGELWEGRKTAVWDALSASITDHHGSAPTAASLGWRWAPLAAAALLALAVGLVGWLAVQHQGAELARTKEQLAEMGERLAQAGQRIADLEGGSAESPQLVVPSLDLFPPSFQRGDAGSPTLVMPHQARFFLLELHTTDTDSQPDYRLSIVRPDGGEVWSGHGLQRTPGGSFRIAVPRQLLTPGHYRLELYGLGEEARLLAEYELEYELEPR